MLNHGARMLWCFPTLCPLTCKAKQGTQWGLNHWDVGDVREVENVVTAYRVCM